MYIRSQEFKDVMKMVIKNAEALTDGELCFVEYIALPYYGHIILRFDLSKESYTLEDLDRYEALLNEKASGDFLYDFMGSVYKKMGLEPKELNAYLLKCQKVYDNVKVGPSIFKERIEEDAQYLLEKCGLKKDLPVWEIQDEDEELDLFILGDKNSLIKKSEIDGLEIVVIETKKAMCEGIMKAEIFARNNKISLARAILKAGEVL